jgi:hypothetical protein
VVGEPVSNRKRDQEIARLFEPMGKRVVALVAAYSAEDRATIVEFLTKRAKFSRKRRPDSERGDDTPSITDPHHFLDRATLFDRVDHEIGLICTGDG